MPAGPASAIRVSGPGECNAVHNSKLLIWTAMVVVAGCGSRKSQTDEISSELGKAPVTVAARKPYVISDAGIRFNPPATWDATRIDVVSRSGKAAASIHPAADFTVSFEYKAEQPAHRNSSLLRLLVLHRSQWEAVAGDSLSGAVVDSTGDWVFVASIPEGNPYREGLLDADQFEAMRVTLDDVRDAFSIESGGPAGGSRTASRK